MSKHDDASLILELYELRRESVMREARTWFFSFNPQGVQDFIDIMMTDKGAYYRMVVSYWEMAASLVNHGAIDEQMFNDANGEHMFVYAKVEPFLPELRRMFGNPGYLDHLDKLIKGMPNIDERLANLRERIKQFTTLREQRAAKAASQEI